MVTVTFQYDTEAMDVFDSVKELTVSRMHIPNLCILLPHVISQLLWRICMHFTTTPILLLKLKMDGTFTLYEKSMEEWVSARAPAHGGSPILIRITTCVPDSKHRQVTDVTQSSSLQLIPLVLLFPLASVTRLSSMRRSTAAKLEYPR
jgi:hypothetical protein